jgi:acyl-coenzyme A synthetase/AMP-(fatty) acid ligase/thioesterase domain-containing protein/acyl carrier protein
VKNEPSALIANLQYWAEVDPDRVALTDDKVALTFSQVLNRVATLAGAISEHRADVEESKVMPILVDRSVDAIIAALSCVYYGIPFSPIDGDTPVERLELLLTRLHCDESIMAVPEYDQLKIKGSAKIFSTNTLAKPLLKPRPVDVDAIANILFTSGSTGVPKGVAFDWKALAERALPSRQYLTKEIPLLKIAITQPLYFAIGQSRQMGVTSGISIFIIDPTKITQTSLLGRLQEVGATNFLAPPSIIRSLGRIPASETIVVPSVQVIETGAEEIRFEDLKAVKRFFAPNVKVTYVFAATEASCGIQNTFQLSEAPESGQVPLGVQTVPGQVWLMPPTDSSSGAQEILFGTRMALGYFEDLVLTQERFLFDDRGKRWWRSGDLVFLDENGVYWHRGREDDLVKVRGKLASPSEATQVIAEIPGIESVIVLPQFLGEAVRLVAHIIKDPESSVKARDVRRALATQLPSHLNPAVIMLHKSFPLTNRGKIDRVALQEKRLRTWRDEPLVLPQSAAEFKVRDEAIFVLDLNGISITDDLWEFGMDSLLAIELLTRIEKMTKSQFTIDDLLQMRTVEKIAAKIEKTFVLKNDPIVINEAGSLQMIYAIPGIGGHASKFLDLTRALGPDQPVMFFPHIAKIKGDFSIEDEAKRVANSIIELGAQEIVPILGFSVGGIVALETARILSKRGIKTHILVLDSALQNFVLSSESVAGRKETMFERILKARRRLIASLADLKNGDIRERWRRYLIYTFHSMIFFASRGRLPRGLGRYQFLAQKKSQRRRNFVTNPVDFDCDVTYFYVAGNAFVSAWQAFIPQLKAVMVAGDHGSMLRPPFVKVLANSISKSVARTSIVSPHPSEN